MKYSIVLLVAAFAVAQDKVPMPPQPQPRPASPSAAPAPAPQSPENKTVVLSDQESWKTRDGVAVKTLNVNSEGYSEVRYTVYAKAPRGKKLGPNAKMTYVVATCTMSEGIDNIDLATKRNEKPTGEGRFEQLVTVKVFSGRNRIFLRFEDLDLDEIVVTVEAYLVK